MSEETQSATIEASDERRPWPWVPILVGVLIVALYADTLWWMVQVWWKTEDLSYSFLVVPGIAYLAYLGYRDGLWERPTPAMRRAGLALVVLGALAGLVFTWGGKGGAAAGTLPLLLAGLALYTWGWRGARTMAAPLLLLLLTNPSLTDLLLLSVTWRGQLMSSAGAAMIARMLGVPLVRVGVNIELPNALITVAKECSGTRTFLGVLALVALLACAARCATWRKLALVAVSVPIALVVNTLRISAIVLAGHLGGQMAAAAWHRGLMIPAAIVAAGLALYVGKWLGCEPWERGSTTSSSDSSSDSSPSSTSEE